MIASRVSLRAILFGLVVAGLALAGSACSEPGANAPVSTEPAASGAAAGSEEFFVGDLVIRDELWPFHVQLTRPVAPEGREAIPRRKAVLIRVIDTEGVRLGFGRFGIHEVPIEHTDVVAKAREIANGSHVKPSNLAMSVVPALYDPRYEQIEPYPRFRETSNDLLLVAAPLDPALLEAMRGPLAEIDAMDRVRVVFLAQGATTNEEIHAALRAAEWTAPYVRKGFIGTFTQAHLGPEPPVPGLGLFTPHGRLLYRAAWQSPEALGELHAALASRLESRRPLPFSAPGAAANTASR